MQVLKSNLALKPFSNFVEEGYRVIYENTNVIEPEFAKKNDFPVFLQATDISTPFISTNSLCYVDETDWIRYPKGRINRGELLIEVKGKIEKVAFVPDDFPEHTLVSGSLYKLQVNQNINKFYLLIYLISKYGQSFKERAKTNLLVSFVSKHDLYKIPVPTFSDAFQLEIERLVKSAHVQTEESKALYAEAEKMLLDELGLSNWQPSTENVAVKSLKESFLETGRLDAEYFQPKYDEIEAKIKEYKYGFDTLGNLSKYVLTGEYSDEYLPKDKGRVFYIRSTNIKNSLIEEDESHFVNPNFERIAVEGDILTARVGTIGIFGAVTENISGSVYSDNILCFRLPDNLNHLVYTRYFNSRFNFELVDRFARGSVQQRLNQETLKDLTVPIFRDEIQQKVKEVLEMSFELQTKSKQLLELAKQAVEVAIEQDEETALQLINGGIN
jgi:type I restriction enzyme, S subunit